MMVFNTGSGVAEEDHQIREEHRSEGEHRSETDRETERQ
jgi:hypothetical protein